MGATRNLVLHGYDGRHTEETIRDDLDHIHNLVVVKVEYHGGNCYISLNSVHNAIYARQCMQSRLYVHQPTFTPFGTMTLTGGMTGDTNTRNSTTMLTSAPSRILRNRPRFGRRPRRPRSRLRRSATASSC